MIVVSDSLTIGDGEYAERFVRASGPGGQHVNKTSTAVELRFDIAASSLPDEVKSRLRRLAGSRLTADDVLVLFAQGARSQELNRQEARERLAELVRRALVRPRARKATRPTRASRLKRLATKSRRSEVKSLRGRPEPD